jgi:hypothetical protein
VLIILLGTGKTFVGLKVMRSLLDNKALRRKGPILVVCFTNHALDQVYFYFYYIFYFFKALQLNKWVVFRRNLGIRRKHRAYWIQIKVGAP